MTTKYPPRMDPELRARMRAWMVEQAMKRRDEDRFWVARAYQHRKENGNR